MSQLDPELRRLIQWSRAACDERPVAAPNGLATRVAGHLREAQAAAEPAWWPRLQFAASWLSVAIVAGGLAVWATRLNRPGNTYDFLPAYNLIARNIAP